MCTTCPIRPFVRVRPGALRTAARRRGLVTDQDTAVHLGISPSTLSRIMHGAPAGGAVIAAVVEAFAGDVAFDELFTVHVEHGQAA